ADKKSTAEAKKEIVDQVNGLGSRLSHNTTVLRQDEFYGDFREQISRAAFSVDISHLDIQPPDHGALPGSATRTYYREFSRFLRNRPDVRFRRVERLSLEKRDWIESLIADMTDRPNCSLSCLVVRNMPAKLPTISVQLVDRQRVYLVAICEHIDAHEPRDISITDVDAASVWLRYYDEMLWGPSLKVIENGNVNQQVLNQVHAEWDRLGA
ncbi:MAG: hypothetical protein K8F25_18765, partial [Fimbriimonadaceae bacterium]|nr:hypothetical protein [Alphaproteobacteria bacterium]